MIVYTDTHCHLDFPQFDQDRNTVILRAKEAGVRFMVNIGSSLEGSRRSVELSKEYDFIYATVGLHPHEADAVNKEMEQELSILARKEKVVAIGEIGLDYFKNFSKQENQRPLFNRLLGLAKELNLPVVLHNREAEVDTLRMVKETMPIRAVVHCFSGDENFLKDCLDLGFYISFTCNITYKKADKLRALVGITPLDRLMLETDAPYLSPEGLRGKRNEPVNVTILAQEIAKIKGISIEEISAATTENAKRFFSLK